MKAMPGTTLNDIDEMDIETLFPQIDYIINKNSVKPKEKLPAWYKEVVTSLKEKK